MDKGDLSDKELLQQIINQNEKAMEQFYHRFSSLVYRFALRTLKTPMDASEIVNEVMMDVWRKADSFADKSSVKTWLLSITHHKAVDLVRKNVRHDHEDDDALAEIADPVCPISDLQDAASNEKYISQCLAELSENHRQVVQLTFYDELSYPEIAEALSIPSGTVKTRMMHAKKQLMACLSRLFNRES